MNNISFVPGYSLVFLASKKGKILYKPKGRQIISRE